ncbi:hypothetical protein GCM10011396_41840 [Undibacterium terreum]|uniref:DUF3311 domain-containing protein n=2 Tax=Oxalobacteraceae TaxID=75682 RepID=A0A916UWK3_9BURK|nr:hypothetical protein GCM10011396_41840 [Undibacterium terreum]
MRGVNSGAIDNECNAASATFKANPSGTAHLGALQRCAASKDGQSLRRDTPRTASQMDSFALPPIDEMSSKYLGDFVMWLLLALPFIGLLWIPFYNQELPTLFGFPFFYWYQFAWVPLTALIIWIVYRDGLKKGVE